MSKNLETIFENQIRISNGAKTVEYYCTCCGANFKSQRRDLTYVISTFLLALRDLGENEYHNYRNVVNYSIKKYNCTPSDYNILLRWKLIESKIGRGNLKYKRLTQAGKDFLDNKLRVSEFHYQIPHTEKIMFSKSKTSFLSLQSQWLEKKEDKAPFRDQSQNNI